VVQAGECPGGEGLDALVEAVVRGELGSLGGQGLALAFEVPAAGLELGGPAGQLGGFDHPGLVEVGQAAALGLRSLGTAVQAGQLGREQLVIGDRGLRRYRSFPGGQQLGPGQQGLDLAEDEGVQFVGPDAPFGAAAVLPAGADRVVVGT
jgi:hypothetical protein